MSAINYLNEVREYFSTEEDELNFRQVKNQLDLTAKTPKELPLATAYLSKFIPKDMASIVESFLRERKVHFLKYERDEALKTLKYRNCTNKEKKHYQSIANSCQNEIIYRINDFVNTYYPVGKIVIQVFQLKQNFKHSHSVNIIEGNFIDELSPGKYQLNLTTHFWRTSVILDFDSLWDLIEEKYIGILLSYADNLKMEDAYEFLAAFDSGKTRDWVCSLSFQSVITVKPNLFVLSLCQLNPSQSFALGYLDFIKKRCTRKYHQFTISEFVDAVINPNLSMFNTLVLVNDPQNLKVINEIAKVHLKG